MNKPHRRKISVFLTYFFAISFIGGWWLFAFKQQPDDNAIKIFLPEEKQKDHQNLLSLLYPFYHEEILAALNGNISLMTKLITEWDIDAQILENAGIPSIQKPSSAAMNKAQILARGIKQGAALNRIRILPQTYASASFLLALLPPEQIVAIPKGLRTLTQICPSALTDLVPLDLDRYHSEKIFQIKPDLAFVASYSHPAAVEMLKRQEIPLFYLSEIEDIPDVKNTLEHLGKLAHCSEKAELLQIFIDSALLAIDNRMVMQKHYSADHSPSVLFINYNSQFFAPTEKTLTGKLLKRLGLNNCLSKYFPIAQNEWTIPLSQEQILQMDPDDLIVGVTFPEAKNAFMRNPSFQKLSAFRNQRIHFVDAALHESPTQHIVLAYYDLFNALTQ